MATEAGFRRVARASRWVLVAVISLAASTVAARTETLRWVHSEPADLARFEARIRSSASGSYGPPVSLGLPAPNAEGIYSGTVTVADDLDAFIVVRAVDIQGLISADSNEIFRPAVASSPSDGGAAVDESPTDGSTSGELAAGSSIPPAANAVLRFDFSSGNTTGWLDTGASNSLVTDDSLFSVADVGGDPALSTRSSSDNVHSHYLGDPSNLRDFVLTGRFVTDAQTAGVGVTTYSQYPSADAYYRLRTTGGGSVFELVGHPDPGASCSGITRTGVIAQAGVWYQFELRVQNEPSGNRISARVWPQGSSRPTSAQAECVDSASSRPVSGAVGVWAMGAGAKFWDDLEVVPLSGTTIVPPVPLEPPVLIEVSPVQ